MMQLALELLQLKGGEGAVAILLLEVSFVHLKFDLLFNLIFTHFKIYLFIYISSCYLYV